MLNQEGVCSLHTVSFLQTLNQTGSLVHKVVPHGNWNDHKMEQMLRKVEKSPSNSTRGCPRFGHNNPQDCCNPIFCSFRFQPFSILRQTCHGVLQNGNNQCGGVLCNQKEHLFVVLVISVIFGVAYSQPFPQTSFSLCSVHVCLSYLFGQTSSRLGLMVVSCPHHYPQYIAETSL